MALLHHTAESQRLATTTETIGGRQRWTSLATVVAGFVLIYLVFHIVVNGLNSQYGEAGVLACALVLGTALAVERLVFKRTAREALRYLGFGRPGWRALLGTLLISLLMLLFFPVFSRITGAPLTIRANWLWVSLGVFAQAGISEELIFRGYLFRHLRDCRTFWRAALLAMLATAAAHLYLFGTMAFPIALSATLLSVLISFPLAYLFERGDNSIWAPALLHFVVQVAMKLVIVPDAVYMPAALGWMAMSLVTPFLAFAILGRRASLR